MRCKKKELDERKDSKRGEEQSKSKVSEGKVPGRTRKREGERVSHHPLPFSPLPLSGASEEFLDAFERLGRHVCGRGGRRQGPVGEGEEGVEGGDLGGLRREGGGGGRGLVRSRFSGRARIGKGRSRRQKKGTIGRGGDRREGVARTHLLLKRIDDLLEVLGEDGPLGRIGGRVHEFVGVGELDVDAAKTKRERRGQTARRRRTKPEQGRGERRRD